MADGFGSFPSPACWILYYNSVEKFNTDHIWELGSGWWMMAYLPALKKNNVLSISKSRCLKMNVIWKSWGVKLKTTLKQVMNEKVKLRCQ